MKIFFIILIFLKSSAIFSQNSMQGLFSNTYLELTSSGEQIIKKSIYIIYNREYCSFFVEGPGTMSFSTFNYQKSIQVDGIHTFFLSLETSVTKEGWYGVDIVENKGGISFQVSQPNDITFYVAKAQKYTEDGKVTSYLSVDYDKSLKWIRFEDSLAKAKSLEKIILKQQKDTEDSTYLVNRDSIKAEAKERKLTAGNNYNRTDLKWLAELVIKNVHISGYCYGDVKVIIDKDGIITKIEASKIFQGEQFIDPINTALVGQKTNPFVAANGKSYPSYGNVYIFLEPKKK